MDILVHINTLAFVKAEIPPKLDNVYKLCLLVLEEHNYLPSIKTLAGPKSEI